MGQLEFVKNKIIRELIPCWTLVRAYVSDRAFSHTYSNWPVSIRICDHMICPTNKFSIVGSDMRCETCMNKIAYKARNGTLYCSELNWRIVHE